MKTSDRTEARRYVTLFLRKTGFFKFFFNRTLWTLRGKNDQKKCFFREKSLEKKGPFFAEEFFQIFWKNRFSHITSSLMTNDVTLYIDLKSDILSNNKFYFFRDVGYSTRQHGPRPATPTTC
jgi:hypothetical protein